MLQAGLGNGAPDGGTPGHLGENRHGEAIGRHQAPQSAQRSLTTCPPPPLLERGAHGVANHSQINDGFVQVPGQHGDGAQDPDESADLAPRISEPGGGLGGKAPEAHHAQNTGHQVRRHQDPALWAGDQADRNLTRSQNQKFGSGIY